MKQQACTKGLCVIEEGVGYLVVNKPAGLLVHPTKPDGRRTLWHQLKEYLAYELANGGQVSLINRLDRETSGLILVATTAEKARLFGLAMAAHQIKKRYIALVNGWPNWESHTVEVPILREGSVRDSAVYLKRCIHEDGEEAITHFNVLERRIHADGLHYAIVEAKPVTGRTHQIRVHLSACGYPILGDKLYGKSEAFYLEFVENGWTENLQRELILPRHALHATGLYVQFDEVIHNWYSPLPHDLTDWMNHTEHK